MSMTKYKALYISGHEEQARAELKLALTQHNQNVVHAARALGISRVGLIRLMRCDHTLMQWHHSERQRLKAAGHKMKGYSLSS